MKCSTKGKKRGKIFKDKIEGNRKFHDGTISIIYTVTCFWKDFYLPIKCQNIEGKNTTQHNQNNKKQLAKQIPAL